MVYTSLTALVGNTPMLELNNYCKLNELTAKIVAKLECFEPCSSVKDRVALAMILSAEKSGELKAGGTIIEPTSGNTGLGLAWVSAARGYKMILVMPESMSIERRKLASQFGAQVVLTPAALGMSGAIAAAEKLSRETIGSYLPRQFSNPINAEAHRQTTAVEILRDMDGKIDIFVAGVGTGGTITGVGEVLKQKIKGVKIYAVEPLSSPVLSGGKAGAHKLQGIGAGFVPEVLNTKVYDGVLQIENNEAIFAAKQLAKTEGLLVGISSGAAVIAAARLARLKENEGKTIVTLFPDTGERYLSTELFE